MNGINHPRAYALVALACVYLVIRFGFTTQLDALGTYASYIFETICLLFATLLLGKKTLTALKTPKATLYGFIVALIAGFSIFKVAVLFGIGIPFDLSGSETILFLLVIAPILEESIFRLFLWEPLQSLTGRPLFVLLVTSVLFSYSHLHAIWFVPVEMQNFVIYQTAYTLVLGIGCGYFMYRYYSLAGAILIHFGFNLGFFISSLF